MKQNSFLIHVFMTSIWIMEFPLPTERVDLIKCQIIRCFLILFYTLEPFLRFSIFFLLNFFKLYGVWATLTPKLNVHATLMITSLLQSCPRLKYCLGHHFSRIHQVCAHAIFKMIQRWFVHSPFFVVFNINIYAFVFACFKTIDRLCSGCRVVTCTL